ncbi:hypothetical protein GCM10010399_55940 [Dactylosporangium fulvum]
MGAGDPGASVDTRPVNSVPRGSAPRTQRTKETTIMPEQPKPQPKPQESTPDTRERARAAVQMSMDRRG